MNEYDGADLRASVPGRVGYSPARGGRAGGRSRAPPAGGAPPAPTGGAARGQRVDVVRHFTRLSQHELRRSTRTSTRSAPAR